MGEILHDSAQTTETVRRAIQQSQESLRVLARRYAINPKTVAKWKKRNSVADLPKGPRQPHSTVLSSEEEAIIIAFRKHTLLPLDDCLYVLQAILPHLTRSSLHRCIAASLFAAPRHLKVAKFRRRQTRKENLQVLPDRLFPPRHCRGEQHTRKAAPFCGH